MCFEISSFEMSSFFSSGYSIGFILHLLQLEWHPKHCSVLLYSVYLEFLEGRGLIFTKMRQICNKDKLQILQNTIKLKCVPNIS